MTAQGISPELAQPDIFGKFAPPQEVPYPGPAHLDEISWGQYDATIHDEALAGTAWLGDLESSPAVYTLGKFDAAKRAEVEELEDTLKQAKTEVNDRLHGVFEEGYNNYWKHVARPKDYTEDTGIPAPVRIFRLPNGRTLLTLSYIPPAAIPEATLAKLRTDLRQDMNDTFFAHLLYEAGDTETGSDALLDSFPDLDDTVDKDHVREDGRGTLMTMLYSDKNGITRIMDETGNLGVCHWYLIRESEDTSAEESAQRHYLNAG
jgi:hypothetical protein